MRLALASVVLTGAILVWASLRLRATVGGLDTSPVPKMIAALRQKPPTQKAYDFAISLAEHRLENFTDLGKVTLSFAELFLLCGFGVIAFVTMFVYASWRQSQVGRLAVSQSPDAAQQGAATDKSTQ